MEKIGFDPTDSELIQFEKQPAKEPALKRREILKYAGWSVVVLGACADTLTLADKARNLWTTPKPVRMVDIGNTPVGGESNLAIDSKPLRLGTLIAPPAVLTGRLVLRAKGIDFLI